ncbi:MAG: TfoX/Sxy family DNA transformation protein [Paracoccaceae bacterium]
MSDPVSSIRNLGPASDRSFARIGITTADQLRALGADAAYLKYMQSGGQPHFIGYYALVMGLQGRPWNDCRGTEKADLRARFDALKAEAQATPSKDKGRLDLEAALDAIGVVKRKA